MVFVFYRHVFLYIWCNQNVIILQLQQYLWNVFVERTYTMLEGSKTSKFSRMVTKFLQPCKQQCLLLGFKVRIERQSQIKLFYVTIVYVSDKVWEFIPSECFRNYLNIDTRQVPTLNCELSVFKLYKRRDQVFHYLIYVRYTENRNPNRSVSDSWL